MTPSKMRTEFAQQLKLFLPALVGGADQYVVEARAMQVPRYNGKGPPIRCVAGFFDLGTTDGKNSLYRELEEYVARDPDLQPEAIYVTANPVDPIFLSRCNNKLSKKGDPISCTDANIVGRRWFLIDVDPTRPIAGISATDQEKAAAREVFDAVLADLAARGFPSPMLVDSGNGWHAYYRVDLPTDDANRVEHALKRLAAVHGTAAAKVDTSIFNAGRVMKLAGTWARKGSCTKDRPHRMSRVIEIPSEE